MFIGYKQTDRQAKFIHRCMTSLDFWKSQFQCTKFIILKRNNCRKTQMMRHGRPYSCGSWLPEDRKDNMWHGREKCCDLWPPVYSD